MGEKKRWLLRANRIFLKKESIINNDGNHQGMECHLDERRQGKFALDGIRQAGKPVIC